MRLFQTIKKPLEEFTFFFACLFCIIPPVINHLLLLYDEYSLDILFLQYLSIAATISYVITTIVYLFRKWTFVKLIAYTFVTALLYIYFFLKLNFGTNISPLIITMIAETNTNEASEFLNGFIFTKMSLITDGIIVSFILFIIMAERNKLLNKEKIKKIISFCMIVCFSVSIYATHIAKSLYECKNMNEVNIWYDKYYPYAMDNISTLLYSLYIPHITSVEIDNVIAHTKESINSKIFVAEDNSLDVIFVIGESYIKYHAHLYGYPLLNTPNMDKEHEKGNLFAFHDMISPYNATTLAIKNILCTNSISDGESWSESVFFPALFKKAGYNVYMWDNQKNLGTFLIYTFTINSLLYNKQLTNISYTKHNMETYEYDGELLQSFFKESTGKHNLVIFHLMGQHVSPSERYRSEFCIFTTNDIHRKESYINEEKKQYIADYDNATLYNDNVLGMLFEHYKSKNAVIVYLSDHGEEAYDVRDSKGRSLEVEKKKEVIKYQNDIPCIIWCSDTYKKLHPDVIENIKLSLNKKGMSDNICHTLFKLANIKTSLYQPKRDIISAEYFNNKRIIYDKYNYDSIILSN